MGRTIPSRQDPDPELDVSGAPCIRLPGVMLGVGLGGFVDGILLHQVLQWHHMVTSTDSDNVGIDYYPKSTVRGLEVNTLWDGVFHTFTWLAIVIGLGVLYSRITGSRRQVWSPKVLWGWVLVGWGLFNVVEGIVDHHILGIHHVRTGDLQTVWDIAFLVFGALLILGGYLIQSRGREVTRAAAHERQSSATSTT